MSELGRGKVGGSFRLLVAVCALGAAPSCSSSASPPPETAPTPTAVGPAPAPASLTAAALTPTTATAPSASPAPQPATSAGPAPRTGPPPAAGTASSGALDAAFQENLAHKRSNAELAKTIPAGCRGAKLDIGALFATKRCDTSEEVIPPPPADALAISLEPGAKTVRPNATVPVTLRLTNRTAEALVVDLERCSDPDLGAYDAKGERADEPSSCFHAGTACLIRHLRVALEPGGTITQKFSFRARIKNTIDLCRIRPPGPMDRGSYTLKVDLPFFDRPDPAKPNTVHGREASAELMVQ